MQSVITDPGEIRRNGHVITKLLKSWIELGYSAQPLKWNA